MYHIKAPDLGNQTKNIKSHDFNVFIAKIAMKIKL